jgi:N-acetylneuraminic acid mutarotase
MAKIERVQLRVVFIIMTAFLMILHAALFGSSVALNTSWTRGEDMPTPRVAASSIALNGKVYIMGGNDVENSEFPITENLGMTTTVEVYDPGKNSWTTASPLPEPLDHSAAAAYNDKIFVVGGFDEDRNPSDKLFIYHSDNDIWEEGNSMPTPRGAATANFINGILYVVGGMKNTEGDDDEGPLQITEAYNPGNNNWITDKAPMPTARHHLQSSVVDGKLYVLGGRISGPGTNVDANEMYDPHQDSWTTFRQMPLKNSGFATESMNGSIYVFGGEDNNYNAYNYAFQYSPKLDEWTTVSALPTPRMGLEAVSIGKEIYVIGGKRGPYLAGSGTNEIFTVSP